MCIRVYINVYSYLQSLVVSQPVLVLQQQLLDVCVQLLGLCVFVLLQLCVSSLFFHQTGLQRSNLFILNAQLALLQKKQTNKKVRTRWETDRREKIRKQRNKQKMKPSKSTCNSYVMFTRMCYHSYAVLLQRGGADDSPQQTAVSDGVLLTFETFVLQLTVDKQQLTPQRLKLLPLGGA